MTKTSPCGELHDDAPEGREIAKTARAGGISSPVATRNNRTLLPIFLQGMVGGYENPYLTRSGAMPQDDAERPISAVMVPGGCRTARVDAFPRAAAGPRRLAAVYCPAYMCPPNRY